MFKITDHLRGEIHETKSTNVANRMISEFLAEGAKFTVEQSFAWRVEITNCENGHIRYKYFDTRKQAEGYVRWFEFVVKEDIGRNYDLKVRKNA